MSRRLSVCLRRSLFCLLVLGLPIPLSHADIPPMPAAEKAPAAAKPVPDNDGYVPENRPATMSTVEEGIPAGPLVATAYGFIWAAVLVFVGLTARRTTQLESEIAQLAERIPAVKTDSPS